MDDTKTMDTETLLKWRDLLRQFVSQDEYVISTLKEKVEMTLAEIKEETEAMTLRMSDIKEIEEELELRGVDV